ncbi:MAG: hypothetical protein P8Z75_05350 [Gammaproteobacteria bacterium]|jgi:ketosteroid isomerase-like protein
MSETVIRNWLAEISRTVAAHDHAAHMQLISRNVSLIGVPGFDSIGFADWSKQCEYEFNQRLIRQVNYGNIRIRVVTEKRLVFKTYESLVDKDGNVTAQGIECILEKEDDGQWRLVEERILSADETRQYDLEPSAVTI